MSPIELRQSKQLDSTFETCPFLTNSHVIWVNARVCRASRGQPLPLPAHDRAAFVPSFPAFRSFTDLTKCWIRSCYGPPVRWKLVHCTVVVWASLPSPGAVWLIIKQEYEASCGLREGGFNRLVKGGCMAALSGACRFESCTSDQTSELTLFQYGFYSQLSSRAISADYSIQTSVPAKSS